MTDPHAARVFWTMIIYDLSGEEAEEIVGCIEGDKEPKTLSCEGISTQDHTQWSGDCRLLMEGPKEER